MENNSELKHRERVIYVTIPILLVVIFVTLLFLGCNSTEKEWTYSTSNLTFHRPFELPVELVEQSPEKIVLKGKPNINNVSNVKPEDRNEIIAEFETINEILIEIQQNEDESSTFREGKITVNFTTERNSYTEELMLKKIGHECYIGREGQLNEYAARIQILQIRSTESDECPISPFFAQTAQN